MLLQINSRLGKLFAIGWNKSTRILLQTNKTFSYWLEQCYSHFVTKYKDDTVHASAKNVKTKNKMDRTKPLIKNVSQSWLSWFSVNCWVGVANVAWDILNDAKSLCQNMSHICNDDSNPYHRKSIISQWAVLPGLGFPDQNLMGWEELSGLMGQMVHVPII